MPWTPLDETAVANMAIDVLDDSPIASLAEDTVLGRFMNRNFWIVHGEVTYAFPWTFAKTWVELPESGSPPPFAWGYAYDLPADCVRPLPLRQGGYFAGVPIVHEVVGQKIYTDKSGPLQFQYIARVENPALWPPHFARVFAMSLALFAAQNVTGKQGYVDKVNGLLKQAWEQASLGETLSMGTPEPQQRHDIIAIRGVGLGIGNGRVTYPSN